MSTEEESAALLAQLMEIYRQHFRRVAGDDTKPAKFSTLGELAGKSRFECIMIDIEADPVGAAFRGEIREIGWQLFVSGGTEMMRRAIEEMDSEHEQSRGILDKLWALIGTDKDIWLP